MNAERIEPPGVAPESASQRRDSVGSRRGHGWWLAGLLALVVIALLLARFPIVGPPETSAPAASSTPAAAPDGASVPAAVPAAPRGIPITEDAKTLPSLQDSDAFVRELLEPIVGVQAVAKLFYPDDLVRRAVVTVDNLPRHASLWPLFPVKPAPGAFAPAPGGDNLMMDPANASRYAPYAALVKAISPQQLVAVYVRIYPLLQQQYRALGFPQGEFNERVITAIDDLLATPDITGAIPLVRGRVMYEFADPDLEALSSGQKLMLRIGPDNAAIVRAKLREIRRLVEAASTPRAPR